MPKMLIHFFQKEIEEVLDFLHQNSQIESLQRVENSFLVNVSASEEEFLQLQENVQGFFEYIEVRSLCRGKCRDGSDCLNSVKKGIFCWKHQESVER